MKKFLFIGGLLYCLSGHTQTTHSVLVKVNQGAECPIINALEEHENIKVFPNPITTSFTILSKMETATLRLLDIQGRAVRSEILRNGEHTFNVEGLTPGIYILMVTNESEVQQFKIKIQ
jgi:hypothetical protein